MLRVRPDQLAAELAAGALVVDIRPAEQRARDGELPGAVVVDRNVLEGGYQAWLRAIRRED
jgi:rhodanese-related sulfurtransferase